MTGIAKGHIAADSPWRTSEDAAQVIRIAISQIYLVHVTLKECDILPHPSGMPTARLTANTRTSVRETLLQYWVHQIKDYGGGF